jgi:alpha-L-fucosidase
VSEGAFQDTKREAFTPEDIRYTCRGDILYALLAKPDAGPRRLHALAVGACVPCAGVRWALLLSHNIELQ